MNKYSKGIITWIISIFFLSTYSIFGKILLENLVPETLAAIAQTLAVITLFLFFWFMPEIRKIHKLPKKDLFWLLITAILSAIIAPLFLLKWLEITTATNSVIIWRLEPVFAGIIAFLWLSEKVSRNQILWWLLMFFGIFFIITKWQFSWISLNHWDLLIIISAFSRATATNIFKKYLSHILPELVVIVRNTVWAIFLFIIIPFVFNIQHNISSIMNTDIILPLVAFSLFTIVFAQLLRYKTLELIPATVASTIWLMSPLFWVLLAVTILKENVYSYHFIWWTFVLFGLALTAIHQQKHQHHHLLQKMKHRFH